MKKIILIFSGFNQRAVIAFIRTLESLGLPYAVIAASQRDTILSSVYASKVVAVRKSIPLQMDDLVEQLQKVKKIHLAQEYIIVPTAEALNRFILKNKFIFEYEQCHIPLVEPALYADISDKYSFGQICKKHGINVPSEYESLESVSLPFVAKPRTYFDSQDRISSPYIIRSEDGKRTFIEKHNPQDFYFQEYIRGESLYLLYYFFKDGGILKFSQRNLMQQAGGKSILAAVSDTVHFTHESEKYEMLFQSLGFSGLVMVELRKNGNTYYMIEANPRFWGPSQLFVDAGVNLFNGFLFDLGLLKEKPRCNNDNFQEYRYFWFGGLLMDIYNGNSPVFLRYNPDNFFEELHVWLENDIYKRHDTIKMFYGEILV